MTRVSDRARRRETVKERANFAASKKAERDFSIHLRKIANKVGHLVEQFDPESPEEMTELEHMLREYSRVIRPWARAVSRRMLTDASRRDEREWRKLSDKMGGLIRQETRRNNPVGAVLRRLHDEQVALITSLPLEAAQRVHDLTIRNLSEGGRAKGIMESIMRSGEVTRARANLIARTEVARSSSLLTQARAEQIGSDGYVWRTSLDQDVRKSHKRMEGKFVRWDSPPTLSDGTVTHAGQIYNCRCYPEPVIPDEPLTRRQT
jgi:SPP1 gp7 family putative phage head morphogenesis protein